MQQRAPTVRERVFFGPNRAAECSHGWSEPCERNPWKTSNWNLAPKGRRNQCAFNARASLLQHIPLFLLLLPLFFLPACHKQPSPPTTTLTIAAAASIKPALDDIAAMFHKAHPEITITTISGSSGHFYEQLQNNAPFDLFYSADTRYPHRLAEAGLALPGSERTYATGSLVLWARSDIGINLNAGARAFLSPAIKKLAIANPETAPYGAAAIAALKSLGVYEQVKDKLVLGENAEQAAQFARIGAAQAAILPISLALSPALKESGEHWTLPHDSYPPIEQAMIILNSTSHPEAARAFDAFLAGPDGRIILASHGFAPPRE